MTPEHPQTRAYQDRLDNGDLIKQITIISHADRHAKASDLQLLERIFDQKPNSSTFESCAKADELIVEAMYNQMNNILEWRDRPDVENHENQAFVVDFDEKTGRGFVKTMENNTIKEYTTNELCIVLKKNNENKNTGFDLLTAYPDVRSPSIMPTNRDLQPLVKQTQVYKTSSPVKKAYHLYQTDPRNTALVTYKQGAYPDDDMLQLNIDTNNPNTKHIVRIKTDGCKLKTKDEIGFMQTRYTQIQDELRPSKNGCPNLNINLNNPTMKKLLTQDYPEAFTTIAKIQKNMANLKQDQIAITKQQMAQADSILPDLNFPENDSGYTDLGCQ